MDRSERARRRAAFGRLWDADAQAKSLAHGLELEEEAEREEAAFEPPRRRRTTGRFVAVAAIAIFVVSSLLILFTMADRYAAEAFMRDHGVAASALVTDKLYMERPQKEFTRAFYVDYRFRLRSPDGHTLEPSVAGFDAVTGSQFAATSIGQTVSIRYNPQRLSQSVLYFAPPPTDREMIIRDALLFGLWVVLFGGLCALIVALAWPEPPRPGTRFGGPRKAKLSG